LFLTELSPVWLKRPLGTAIEMLRRSEHHLRHVGTVRVRALFAEYVQPALIETFGALPIFGMLFKGPRWASAC